MRFDPSRARVVSADSIRRIDRGPVRIFVSVHSESDGKALVYRVRTGFLKGHQVWYAIGGKFPIDAAELSEK